jgi:Family of unknown function (DUF6459)
MASPARDNCSQGTANAAPAARSPLRLVPGRDVTSKAERHAGPGAIPDPRPFVNRLAQAIAEVLAGVRSARQLDDLVAPDVIRLLCRSAGRLSARPGSSRDRPIVHSVHVSGPCPGVAEACAVINVGSRKRAIALRLEATDRHWRCTALHVG